MKEKKLISGKYYWILRSKYDLWRPAQYYHKNNTMYFDKKEYPIKDLLDIKALILPPPILNMLITNKDIATIEVMHDLLLDKYNHTLNSEVLTNSRGLISKMYKAIE